MSAEDFKWPEKIDAPKVNVDEWKTPAPERQVNPLAVLSNKIPKADLEAFYDYYTKENPQAKEAVDTVIKAFSPDKIQKFLESCGDVPLPSDASTYKEFCSVYKDQLRNVQEAPKVETNNAQETQGNKKIAEATQGIAEKQQEIPKEKAEISAKRQEILAILTP